MKYFTFLFLMTVCFSKTASADQVALSYNYGFFAMIAGLPNDGKPDKLQTDGYNYGSQFDLTYLYGEDIGILGGIAHGVVYESFSYNATGGVSETYQSAFSYKGIKLGVWKQTPTGEMIQLNFMYAPGKFKFFGEDPAVEGKDTFTGMLEMEVRGIYPFYNVKGVKLDLLGGVKVFKIFLPELSYNGRVYGSNDAQDNSKIQITVGLGLSRIVDWDWLE